MGEGSPLAGGHRSVNDGAISRIKWHKSAGREADGVHTYIAQQAVPLAE